MATPNPGDPRLRRLRPHPELLRRRCGTLGGGGSSTRGRGVLDTSFMGVVGHAPRVDVRVGGERRREVLPARQRARQLAGPRARTSTRRSIRPAPGASRFTRRTRASGRASTRTSSTGRWPTPRPSRRPTRRPRCSSCAPRTPRIWWRSPTWSAATPRGRTPSETRSPWRSSSWPRPRRPRATCGCSTASTCTTPSPGKGWVTPRRSGNDVDDGGRCPRAGLDQLDVPGDGHLRQRVQRPQRRRRRQHPDPSTGAQEADILGMYGRLHDQWARRSGQLRSAPGDFQVTSAGPSEASRPPGIPGGAGAGSLRMHHWVAFGV